MRRFLLMLLAVTMLLPATLFAAPHSVSWTPNVNVYGQLWRNNPVGGARQIWNTAVPGWQTYAGGSVADYDWPCTEQGGVNSSGEYGVTYTSSILDDAPLITVKYYVRAGGSPAIGDTRIESNEWTLDPATDQLVIPGFVVGGSLTRGIRADYFGPDRVYGKMDAGVRPTGGEPEWISAPLPSSGVTLASTGAYTFTSGATDKLVRSTTELDFSKDWRFDFTSTISGTGTIYVGVFEAPANLNDVSATLIDPSESASAKDLCRAGFILRTSANRQLVFATGGQYYAADGSGETSPTGVYAIIWDASDQTLTLYSVANGVDTLIATVSQSLAGGVIGQSGLSLGVVANSVGTSFQFAGQATGRGWVDGILPTAEAVREDLDANSTIADNAATAVSQTLSTAFRTALGLSTNNLDSQLFAIDEATTETIPEAIDAIDTGAGEPDTRDLGPVQHTWQLKRSGVGTLQSTNPWYVSAGDGDSEGIRGGWNCDIPSILPPGTVIATQANPPELVTPSDDITITHIGHDGKTAKVQLEIADDAEPGSHWVKTLITNSNGGGPIAIYGEVVIQAEPE